MVTPVIKTYSRMSFCNPYFPTPLLGSNSRKGILSDVENVGSGNINRDTVDVILTVFDAPNKKIIGVHHNAKGNYELQARIPIEETEWLDYPLTWASDGFDFNVPLDYSIEIKYLIKGTNISEFNLKQFYVNPTTTNIGVGDCGNATNDTAGFYNDYDEVINGGHNPIDLDGNPLPRDKSKCTERGKNEWLCRK